MKIYLSSDHAGFEFKEKLKVFLADLNHEAVDMGPAVFDPTDDYPDYITPMAQAVAKDPMSMGIILGGSGQGEAMCANRVPGVRAAVFYGPVFPKLPVDQEGRESKDQFEILKLARYHNNANILSLGARFVSEEEMKQAIKIFIETLFSEDERHARRLKKF
jgi:ribose 5-phosphate isomerase B